MSRVYFIRPIGMDGPVKIGCSVSPEGRRKALETWSPFALEVIAEIDGSTLLERRFHAAFVKTHERREWFGWSEDIKEAVAAINAGTFDIATLPAPRRVSHSVRGVKRDRSPTQRLQSSFSQREWRVRQRSGYAPPINIYGIAERDNAEEIALAEAYFLNPETVGEAIDSLWAKRARAEQAAAA